MQTDASEERILQWLTAKAAVTMSAETLAERRHDLRVLAEVLTVLGRISLPDDVEP